MNSRPRLRFLGVEVQAPKTQDLVIALMVAALVVAVVWFLHGGQASAELLSMVAAAAFCGSAASSFGFQFEKKPFATLIVIVGAVALSAGLAVLLF